LKRPGDDLDGRRIDGTTVKAAAKRLDKDASRNPGFVGFRNFEQAVKNPECRPTLVAPSLTDALPDIRALDFGKEPIEKVRVRSI
jgi:hypothetical protein